MNKRIYLLFFIISYLFSQATTYGQSCQSIYASLPYTQNFDNTWADVCGTDHDAPDSSWTNSNPGTLSMENYGWRRSDYNAWGDNFYPYPSGNYCAAFHTTNTTGPDILDTSMLDLHINCSGATGEKLLSFYYINNGGTDNVSVYLSTDSGNNFTLLGNFGAVDSWTQYYVPFVSNTPKTIIRFSGMSVFGNNGTSDIGLDSVQVFLPCDGLPSAGNIIEGTACPGGTVDLNLVGVAVAGGISYSWQQSSDGTNWTDISGIVTLSGTVIPGITVTPTGAAYFRAKVMCINSGLTAYTPAVFINNVIPYSAIPYTQDFESWISTCEDLNAPDSTWDNIPATGSNSWRRNDQGYTANWIDNGDNGGPYLAAHGTYFARFDCWWGEEGDLDVHVNCSNSGGNAVLSFYYLNENYPDDSLHVYMSLDSGGTFVEIGNYGYSGGGNGFPGIWTNYSIPIASTSPKTIIRFDEVHIGSGISWYDVGVDLVQVLMPCQGMPASGNIMVGGPCPSGVNLSLIDTTLASNISYAWQQSVDDLNWTDISGATSSSITVTPPAIPTYFRTISTCPVSGLTDTSPVATVYDTIPYSPIPYIQDFESWVSCCSNLDAPDSSWVNSPAIGNNSWRRNDQGVTGEWGGNGWDIPSIAAHGNYFACFNSYGVTGNTFTGTTGTLDLHLNCSALPGDKVLGFSYVNGNNAAASDSLHVYLSTDSGTTFNVIGQYGGGIDNWSNYIIPFISNSPKTIIRFIATESNSGYSAVGLDYVQVTPVCQGTPDAGNIIEGTACPGVSANLVLAGESTGPDLSYFWQQSVDNVNWTTISGVTITTATVNPQVPTYYRAVTTCTASNLSAATPAVLINNTNHYDAIPYTQDFESWVSMCATSDHPDSGWSNNPITGNNSWRRNDQGATANWSITGDIPGAAAHGNYYACFNAPGLSSSGTNDGTFDLHIDCSTASGNELLSFFYINQNSANTSLGMPPALNVFLSTNSGITFNQIGTYNEADAWTNYTIPFSSSSKTIIRFAPSNNGVSYAYPIGLDYVQILPSCQGTPVAGPITATQTYSYAVPYTSILSTTATANNMTCQWQSSTDSSNWTNIAGATNLADTVRVCTTTYYRAVVICTNSGQSDTSAGIKLQIDTDVVPVYIAGSSAVCQGESVTLSSGITTATNYQWYLDGQPISGAATYTYNATQLGAYTVVLNALGCPSETSLADTVIIYPPPDPVITMVGGQLTTSAYTSYQWYLDGQLISGATDQGYAPTVNGIYTVVVSDTNGCAGQSVNDTLSTLNVPAITDVQSIKLYPDPNAGIFIVKGILNNAGAATVTFEVTNVIGQVVYKTGQDINRGAWEVRIALDNDIADGLYLMRIDIEGASQVIKFAVER